MKLSNKSIGSRILTGYVIIGAILSVLAGCVIFTNITTGRNLKTIDSYTVFYDYPSQISMEFADARVRNRTMMMSIFYDDSVYEDGISLMDSVSNTFSEFKSGTTKYGLTDLSSLIEKTSGQIDTYKQLMVDNHENNKAKFETQSRWSASGGDCLRIIAGMNEYINTYWSSLSDASTEVYRVVLENKLALEASRTFITVIRLNSLDMMYMDEINNYEQILSDIDGMNELLDSYKEYAYDDILPMIDTLKEYFVEYRELTTEYYQLIKKTDENIEKFNNINLELQQSLDDINNETTSSIHQVTLNADSQQSTTLIILIISSVVLILTIALCAFILIRSVSSALKSAAESLRKATDKIHGYSDKITSVASRLSESGAEQSSSIAETSATMTQTASMAKRNSEDTRQVADLAAVTLNSAFHGVDAMNSLVNFMEKLSQSSDEISKIVDSINTIASQTNILALNASVEAARSGDAGRSFAVVAEEVRTLSQKSSQAAKSTASIVNENITLSNQSVEKSSNVNSILKEISDDIQQVARLISNVSAASEEQTRGVQQIDIALAQMDKVSHSNAAIAEESSEAANELKNQADNLLRVYRDIEILVYGAAD